MRGIAGGSVCTLRLRCVRHRPPSPGHRRGGLPLPRLRGIRRRRRHAPGRAGHRCLVRLGIDADGPVGLPGGPRLRRVVRLPGRLHLRGHRPDTRLVLLAASRQHAGARVHAISQRPLPRTHRRRRRAQDVQERRQRHRPVGDPLHPGGRPAAVVDVLPGLAVDTHPSEFRGHRRRHAGLDAYLVEHVVLLHHVCRPQRVRPGRSRHSGSRRQVDAGPLDAVAAARHRRPGHRVPRRL